MYSITYRKGARLPKSTLSNWIMWLLHEKYQGKAGKNYYKDIERLKKGEPLDYVIGFTEFLGCKIDLSKKPLIPRPETEYWVQKAIHDLRRITSPAKSPKTVISVSPKLFNRMNDLRMLDLFAGSGCVGISIIHHIGKVKVVFAEKDKNALSQIKINCRLNKLKKERYKIVQSDVFKNVRGKFDYIFANPPYIPIKRKNKIQKSVLGYEPKQALFGGSDGLLYIGKFLAGAKNFLKPGGVIYMEFDLSQQSAIQKLLGKYGYADGEFCKDQYGKLRYLIIREKL